MNYIKLKVVSDFCKYPFINCDQRTTRGNCVTTVTCKIAVKKDDAVIVGPISTASTSATPDSGWQVSKVKCGNDWSYT